MMAGPLADSLFGPLLTPNGALASSVGKIIGTGAGRGYGLIFVFCGLLTMLAAILGYFNPRLRRIEEELPDAIP